MTSEESLIFKSIRLHILLVQVFKLHSVIIAYIRNFRTEINKFLATKQSETTKYF